MPKFTFNPGKFENDLEKSRKHIERAGEILISYSPSISKRRLFAELSRNTAYLCKYVRIALRVIAKEVREVGGKRIKNLRTLARSHFGDMPTFLTSLTKEYGKLLYHLTECDEIKMLGHAMRDHETLEPLKKVMDLVGTMQMYLANSPHFR